MNRKLDNGKLIKIFLNSKLYFLQNYLLGFLHHLSVDKFPLNSMLLFSISSSHSELVALKMPKTANLKLFPEISAYFQNYWLDIFYRSLIAISICRKFFNNNVCGFLPFFVNFSWPSMLKNANVVEFSRFFRSLLPDLFPLKCLFVKVISESFDQS